MRGKLRDKRTSNKREVLKREEVEQRRPYKRDARLMTWLADQDEDEDENYALDEEDVAADMESEVPDKHQTLPSGQKV